MKRIWIYLFVIFWLVPDAISQTGQIRGKVFDFRQNQPLVGQLIVLERHRDEQTSRRETETDAKGHYRFQNLAPSSTDHYTVFTEFKGRTYREEHVLMVHGSGFSPLYGKGHFRLVFLPSLEIINEAFDRIERFMLRYKK